LESRCDERIGSDSLDRGMEDAPCVELELIENGVQ
jgi:hypothetical protein